MTDQHLQKEQKILRHGRLVDREVVPASAILTGLPLHSLCNLCHQQHHPDHRQTLALAMIKLKHLKKGSGGSLLHGKSKRVCAADAVTRLVRGRDSACATGTPLSMLIIE